MASGVHWLVIGLSPCGVVLLRWSWSSGAPPGAVLRAGARLCSCRAGRAGGCGGSGLRGRKVQRREVAGRGAGGGVSGGRTVLAGLLVCVGVDVDERYPVSVVGAGHPFGLAEGAQERAGVAVDVQVAVRLGAGPPVLASGPGSFGRAVLDLRDPGRDLGCELAEDIRFGNAACPGERTVQRAAVIKVTVASEDVAALLSLLDARRGADKQSLGVAGGRDHALVGDDRLERRRGG